jgi:hypothetical protein
MYENAFWWPQEHPLPLDLTRPTDPDDEVEYWKLSVLQKDPTCEGYHEKDVTGPDRVFYIGILTKGEQLPLCSALNWLSLNHRLHLHNAVGIYNIRYIIIRQFYTPLCPPYTVDGKPEFLNAFVVQRMERDEWANQDVFMCSMTLKKNKKTPSEPIPGGWAEQTAAEAYAPSVIYTVKRVYHDDRCGTGSTANAYMVHFHEPD